MTYQEIKAMSSKELRNHLKEDLDVDLIDMITYELFEVREE
jgi:hypothetical protein|tara:strand:- start:318 stop:440 length:123 start_codon:yes stop_codon:yes gene_type:complete